MSSSMFYFTGGKMKQKRIMQEERKLLKGMQQCLVKVMMIAWNMSL